MFSQGGGGCRSFWGKGSPRVRDCAPCMEHRAPARGPPRPVGHDASCTVHRSVGPCPRRTRSTSPTPRAGSHHHDARCTTRRAHGSPKA